MDPLPLSRQALLDAVSEAGRGNSTATVLFHAAVAESAGLGASDHKALDLLMRGGPLTAGDLTQRVGLSPASVSALIDRLEGRGYVRRKRDPNDGRRVLVEPVVEGLVPLHEAFGPFQTGLAGVLATYSDEELRTILSFLNRTTALLLTSAQPPGDHGKPGG